MDDLKHKLKAIIDPDQTVTVCLGESKYVKIETNYKYRNHHAIEDLIF